MRNSVDWWNSVKSDEISLINWLKDQYHGEMLASKRIREHFSKFSLSKIQQLIITKIAKEEELHAEWIGKLLLSRGYFPDILEKHERYWEATLKGMDTAEDVAAIGAHAEAMRLERIEAIATDETAPEDIRNVFLKIWPMEVAHELLFEKISSPEAMLRHKGNSDAGRQALGLVV